MKFGGTSLADISRINSAALKIKKEILKGYSVIVVVSAMSGTTNNLIKLVKGIDESFDLSEHDTVVSTGEQISSGLITIALQAIGIKAKSFSGWQIPIITDEHFGKASINEIKTSNIVNELKKDKVPVISGFQGITSSNRVSTLGRGGSDTSAVAIAAAFNAERCDIYTDVDGVYTTDPRIEPKAVKLNFITFEEMLELSSQGAKVLHARSVALAMNHNVKLQVLSSFDNKPGTMIVNEDSNMEKTKISGVAYSSNEAKITLYNVMDKPGQAANIFGTLADNAINVDMIVQSSTLDGSATDITFTVLETDLANTIQIIQRLKEDINFTHILEDSKVTKVSVVGSGMRTKPGIAKTMFETLARNNINIQVISTSEIKISVLISSEYTELAVRTLHEAFELDKI
tara:strand:- start:2095 stop:3300 length:1206 start_codon:yes stop_codon:yes gene_type:complete